MEKARQGEQYNYSDDTNKQYNGSLSEKIDDTEGYRGELTYIMPHILNLAQSISPVIHILNMQR